MDLTTLVSAPAQGDAAPAADAPTPAVSGDATPDSEFAQLLGRQAGQPPGDAAAAALPDEAAILAAVTAQPDLQSGGIDVAAASPTSSAQVGDAQIVSPGGSGLPLSGLALPLPSAVPPPVADLPAEPGGDMMPSTQPRPAPSAQPALAAGLAAQARGGESPAGVAEDAVDLETGKASIGVADDGEAPPRPAPLASLDRWLSGPQPSSTTTGPGPTALAAALPGGGEAAHRPAAELRPAVLNLPPNPTPADLEAGLSERIQWMVRGGVQAAEIRLDPPRLGSLEINVSLQEERATVTINASHANLRELLDIAAPRLREMMAQAGFEQVDVSVGSQQRDQAEQTPQGHGWHGDGLDNGAAEPEPGPAMSASRALLDLYA